MSGKLDQSLEDIVKTRRGNTARRGRRVRTAARPSAIVAPVGGVTKSSVRNAAKASTVKSAAAATIPATGESKIIVSGLPLDVEEDQIQDYFSKTIGPVKKVFLTYGPNGKSKGISTVVFKKPGSAVEAATQMNGVKIDNKTMRIEVIVGANQAPAAAPAKALGDRIASKPAKPAANSQPKPASNTKPARDTTGRRGRARKGRNPGRGKPKTAEELDAEMTDYFDGGVNGAGAVTTNGATTQAVATGGDTGMEDEIL